MTQKKYSTQTNNKYNDLFINKYEKPSNIIQKRLEKASDTKSDEEIRAEGNRNGYANLVNEYKKLGVTTMPDFNTYDVNDPNYMDKYNPSKALAAQKHNKAWGLLTPAQQYAYTTLSDSAKTLGINVPDIESVDLSSPFWLAKTLNEVNEKISFLNYKDSFTANRSNAYDAFKTNAMYFDDRTRFNDEAKWQKLWNDSAQSKLWTDDVFNSLWNKQLIVDRIQNGVWDLGQWDKSKGGGGGGGGGGGDGSGSGSGDGTTNDPNIKNQTPDQIAESFVNDYLNGNNKDGPNGEPVKYNPGTPEYADALKFANQTVWKHFGPKFSQSWGRNVPNYLAAQGVTNNYRGDGSNNNQTVSNGGGPAKLTAEQQKYVDGYANELKIQYGENSDEYKTFLLTPPFKQIKAGVDDGYLGGQVSLGTPYVPSKDAQGNVYGSSAYTNQAVIDWQNKQKAKFATGLNPLAIPNFKTITEAVAAGMDSADAAGMFGVYPNSGSTIRINNNFVQPTKTPYDKISPTVGTNIINPTATIGVSATAIPNATAILNATATPSGIQKPIFGEPTVVSTKTTATPVLGIDKPKWPTITPIPIKKRGYTVSNTKKFMGGKTGRMGPLIDDGIGEKGRYFEKGNARKSQSKNAIKFYETDKTDNVPMSKSFIKALTQKIHEINSANYYGNEKPRRSDSIRKDGDFGSSVNLGGTINNYVSPNQKIPSKQMYELDTPRQKTPTPMGTTAMKKPMGGSLNAFNPYPRSGSMATGMGSPTMKRMTTQKTITRLSQKSLPQGMPTPPKKVSSKYR